MSSRQSAQLSETTLTNLSPESHELFVPERRVGDLVSPEVLYSLLRSNNRLQLIGKLLLFPKIASK